MNEPIHQRELPLTNQTETPELLPEKVMAECRQLLVQMLQAVLQANKEAQNER